MAKVFRKSEFFENHERNILNWLLVEPENLDFFTLDADFFDIDIFKKLYISMRKMRLNKKEINFITLSAESGVLISDMAEQFYIKMTYGKEFIFHFLRAKLEDYEQVKLQKYISAGDIEKVYEFQQVKENLLKSQDIEILSSSDILDNTPIEAEVCSFGISELDQELSICKGDILVVAGRPGVGKSSLGTTACCYNVKNGNNVLYFSLEMSKPMIAKRFANQECFRQKCIISLSYLTIGLLEKIIIEQKPSAVIIDQLNKIEPKSRYTGLREKFVHSMMELKQLAIRTETAIVVLAQLKRGDELTKPTMSDLKESGSIEEEADSVVLLHKGKDGFRALIEKNRRGEAGKDLQLWFDGKKQKFSGITKELPF
jgi:hypothetical protein